MRKILMATAASLLALAGAANAQPAKPVAAPGTIVVHLNGYLQFSVNAYGNSGMVDGNSYNMTGGTGASAYKLSPIGMIGDVRLYPGFDAQTVDGLWYGAQIELRTATSNANGAGVNSNSTSANGVNGIYVRRAYGYIGTPDAGFVRFGQTDSAFSLLQRGVVEGFGDGNGWPADGGPDSVFAQGAPKTFIYADQGALYTTNKIVLISPAVAEPVLGGKFDAAVGYEPNSNGIKEGYATTASCAGANDASCGTASSSRRRNTVDAVLDYTDSQNGFATKASVGYLYGAPLGVIGSAQPYDSLGVFQAGIQTTYMGVTVGGNVKAGTVQDGYALTPKGGRHAVGYTLGASYANGPIMVGGSFFDEQSAGKWASGGTYARTLSEYGLNVGANYTIAKPLSLFVDGMYFHDHQPSATNGTNAQGELVSVGTTIKW
jgi:hypothetical protein